ncbi:endonuclease domain-containing protein [Fuscovulum blasticum]|uniref:endonuclease domain-containing protein n=1 Tax=Fuscovulum blasticum TaxID=1075 RepID=UPI0019D1F0B0|nr:endonuclease domain-containing protein [Fuscovulum blasticum]
MKHLITRGLMFGKLIKLSPLAPTPGPSQQGGGEVLVWWAGAQVAGGLLPSPLFGGAGGWGFGHEGNGMTGIHPVTRQRARALRAAMTPQERKVWPKLRELNRMLGANFRRQAPIGPYIADFAELGRRLVIEIDGAEHGGAQDARRDAWLKGQGFQVLRFWNSEISENLEGVMQMVLDAVGPLGDAPPPHPFPTGLEGGSGRQPQARRDEPGASLPPCGEGLGVGATRPERAR